MGHSVDSEPETTAVTPFSGCVSLRKLSASLCLCLLLCTTGSTITVPTSCVPHEDCSR